MKYPGPHRSQVGRALETLSLSVLYITLTPFLPLDFFSLFFSDFADFVAGAASAADFDSSFLWVVDIMQSPLPWV
jgi:hypothetical protein